MREMTNEMNSSFRPKYASIAIDAASHTIRLSEEDTWKELKTTSATVMETTNCATL